MPDTEQTADAVQPRGSVGTGQSQTKDMEMHEQARGGKVWRGQEPSDTVSAYAQCNGRQTAP